MNDVKVSSPSYIYTIPRTASIVYSILWISYRAGLTFGLFTIQSLQ